MFRCLFFIPISTLENVSCFTKVIKEFMCGNRDSGLTEAQAAIDVIKRSYNFEYRENVLALRCYIN